jgi:hypothetical protein
MYSRALRRSRTSASSPILFDGGEVLKITAWLWICLQLSRGIAASHGGYPDACCIFPNQAAVEHSRLLTPMPAFTSRFPTHPLSPDDLLQYPRSQHSERRCQVTLVGWEKEGDALASYTAITESQMALGPLLRDPAGCRGWADPEYFDSAPACCVRHHIHPDTQRLYACSPSGSRG